MITDEAFKILNLQDWKKITKKLILHISWLMNALPKYDKLSGGTQIADIIQDAICKLYNGERTWNPTVDPDLLKFLVKSILPSLVNNYYKTAAVKINGSFVKNEIRSSSLDSKFIDDEEGSDFWENRKSKEPLPDEEIFAKEIIEMIRKNLLEDNDDDGLIIFNELIKGNKPSEIAKDLGITVSEVNKAFKRIRNTKAKKYKPLSKSKNE